MNEKQTIIAIVNEKGGTAKTTTTVSLAAALGEAGQKVLVVDLDGQAASSRWLGVEEDNRLAEAMMRGGDLVPVPEVLPNVSLAPASGHLDSVAHELRPTQGGQLRKVLRELTQFDFILIDCPPSLGNRLIGNALLAATHVIVPVETSILALDGLKILLTTLDDVREGFDHRIILGGVLACRFDSRTRLSTLVLNELRRALPGKVFQTIIRENVRVRECPGSGKSILTFAPDSHGAEDYRSLAQEMLSHPEIWRNFESDSIPGEMISMEAVGSMRSNASEKLRESTGPSPASPAVLEEIPMVEEDAVVVIQEEPQELSDTGKVLNDWLENLNVAEKDLLEKEQDVVILGQDPEPLDAEDGVEEAPLPPIEESSVDVYASQELPEVIEEIPPISQKTPAAAETETLAPWLLEEKNGTEAATESPVTPAESTSAQEESEEPDEFFTEFPFRPEVSKDAQSAEAQVDPQNIGEESTPASLPECAAEPEPEEAMESAGESVVFNESQSSEHEEESEGEISRRGIIPFGEPVKPEEQQPLESPEGEAFPALRSLLEKIKQEHPEDRPENRKAAGPKPAWRKIFEKHPN
jgi:chromosome partitioning protein